MAIIELTMRHTRHEGTGLSTDTKPSGNYDDRIYETDTGDEYKCFGGDNWKLISTGGAVRVQQAGEGPATQARNRALSNVTTRQKVEWPAGANITYLTVFAMLEEGTTLVAGAEKDVYAVLSVDPENDTEADGNLGTTSNPPSSATADAQFIPVPLGVFVTIPMTAALVNGSYGGGRVDVRSVDGTALNIWIGAN